MSSNPALISCLQHLPTPVHPAHVDYLLVVSPGKLTHTLGESQQIEKKLSYARRPQGAAEHQFPLQPQVVGVLSSHVEWVVSNGQHGKEGTTDGPYVRCFGILWMMGTWFQLELHGSWREVHITVKELLPIVLGVAVWGPLCSLIICC